MADNGNMSGLSSLAASGYRTLPSPKGKVSLRDRLLSISLLPLFVLPLGLSVLTLIGTTQAGWNSVLWALAGLSTSWLTVGVLSSTRKVIVGAISGVFLASVFALVGFGGGSVGLWVAGWGFAALYSATLVLTSRWGRVDPGVVVAVYAVMLASLFAGGATVAASVEVFFAAVVLSAVTVSLSVAIPRLLYFTAVGRAKMTRDRDTFDWAAATGQQADERGGRRPNVAAVRSALTALPRGFSVMPSVQLAQGVDPADFVVVGRTGVFLLNVVAPSSVPTAHKHVLSIPAVNEDATFSRIDRQRTALARRLGVTKKHITCLLVLDLPDGVEYQQRIAYREEGLEPFDVVSAVTVETLRDEIDTPLMGMSQKRADVVSTKVAATCRPASTPLAAPSPYVWMQLGVVQPDGAVQWGLRDRRSVTVNVNIGALVNLESSPTRDGYRVLSAPEISRQSVAVTVQVCRNSDYPHHLAGKPVDVFSVALSDIKPFVPAA